MAQLLGIRIQNWKSLADVTLGRLSSKSSGVDLPLVSCFIGRNGCGKSSLLDVFAFLADCLREGVEAACDKEHRGGFERIRTQGKTGPIVLTLYFQLTGERPIRYELSVDLLDGVPSVAAERLDQTSDDVKTGRLKMFLNVRQGQGQIWKGGSSKGGTGRGTVKLADRDRLAIATYGQLSDHPRISKFREYLESWYLSYFVPGDARRLAGTGAQRRLDRTGSNIGNVLQYMQRNHGDRLKTILTEIASAIPGITTITAKDSEDKRLLIAFGEEGYADPFFQYAMSDGTLKMFAYLLLLHDPEPPTFIGIEEPENGLYHQLHGQLASQMLSLTQQPSTRTQVLVTTHSPYFVDTLQPEQVWLMAKQADGTSAITRAADVPRVQELVEEGVPLGSLWFSNHLDQD